MEEKPQDQQNAQTASQPPYQTSPPMPYQTTPQPTVNQAAPLASTGDDEPKSYLAMMLLAFFAGPTGLARVYRGEKSGWVRFWIYVASYILTFVFIGSIGVIALTIWGIVDFFLLRKASTDSTGRPLHTTVRDNKVVTWLFRVMIAMLALVGVVIVVVALMFSFLVSMFQDAAHSSGTQTNSEPTNSSSFYQ